jgi:hypothetical protein
MRENKGALNMVKYQAELIRTGIKAEWDELMAETL